MALRSGCGCRSSCQADETGGREAEPTRFEKGAAILKQLFGFEPKPGQAQGPIAQEDFSRITVENLFGDIWARPGLELQERSMITIAALTVLAREPELKTHLRGALRIGIPREKINEMMIHLAHYGGWPTGVGGLRVAKEVFDEADAKK